MATNEIPIGVRSLSHTITWGINLAMYSNMIQFMHFHGGPARSGIHSYGPVLLMFVAMILMMADLTRHILLDADVSTLYMFQANPVTGEQELTWAGTLGVASTWLGVTFMFVSIAWYTDIVSKMRTSFGHVTNLLAENDAPNESLLPPNSATA